MADISQLESALVKADAAGDVEGAKVLAGEIIRLRGVPVAPPEAPKPTGYERLLSGGIKGLLQGGPISAMREMAGTGLDIAGEAVTKGAYEAGGKVSELAGRAGLPAEAAGGLGFATNVGLQAIPALIGGGAAKAVAPLMEGAAARLMQSALKPPLKELRRGQAAEAIQTMLDEGINVSQGGVTKLREKIGELNRQIGEAIASSPATVDKNKVAQELLGTLDRFKKQVTPQSDIAVIESAWKNFINHPLLTGDQIPIQLAQELKQGTYRALKGKYGELGSAETESQKTLARGLKEGVAEGAPVVRPLNAEESKLLNALSLTERRVLISMNKNPMGLSLLSTHPAAWASFLADRSELFKSIVARMMYSGAERIPQAAGGVGVALGETALNRQQQ